MGQGGNEAPRWQARKPGGARSRREGWRQPSPEAHRAGAGEVAPAREEYYGTISGDEERGPPKTVTEECVRDRVAHGRGRVGRRCGVPIGVARCRSAWAGC